MRTGPQNHDSAPAAVRPAASPRVVHDVAHETTSPSSQAASGGRWADALAQSPRMAAQRQKHEALFRGAAWQPLQRVPGGDSEPGHGLPLPGSGRAPTPSATAGLPRALRSGMEALSGLDLSGVRVHENSSLPQTLQAHAFAQGQDIHLGPGQEQHLPHEAWHVVQQAQGRVPVTRHLGDDSAVNDEPALEKEADAMGQRAMQMAAREQAAEVHVAVASASSTGTAVVQGDVGFEMETRRLDTRKMNGGVAVPGILHHKPAMMADGAWQQQLDGQSTRLTKGNGDEFLSHPSFSVQGDDNGDRSDGEIVTTHFPETVAGRALLQTALADMVAMEQRLQNLAAGQVATAGELAGGNLAATRADVFIGWPAAFAQGWKGAPQITGALALRNVRTVTRDLLYDPQESAVQEQLRRPGREITRGLTPMGQSKTAGNFGAAAGLVEGMARADEAVAAYRQTHPQAPASESLKGLLTLVYSITETVRIGGASPFLKAASALLPKTDFATMFATLPANVQSYYSQQNLLGQVRFVELVASATHYGNARMGRPVFDVGIGTLPDETGANEPEWFRSLLLKDWVRSMTVGGDTQFNRFVEFFHGQRNRDKLTTDEFPSLPANKDVEGFGVLGGHMDTQPQSHEQQPVMELRFASQLMDLAQFHAEALKLFDYLVSVNQDHPTRIV